MQQRYALAARAAHVTRLALLGGFLTLLPGLVLAQSVTVAGPTGSGLFGSTVTVLTNGNYVVTDPGYDNGATLDVGAAYLYNGSTNVLISTLTGTTASDQVGSGGVTVLSGGNFLVRSPNWDNGAAVNAGAVTWGSGTAGVSGAVSAANSLVGSTTTDQVGSGGITVLTNGNYVVNSSSWNNGAAANAGAATWGSGTAGVSGAVSAANSLVGGAAGNSVGSSGTTALPNGNYVVVSLAWDSGAIADVGAVTWGNGTSGSSGTVSAVNSLVGSAASDLIGNNGVTILANGNYVVSSPNWDNGAVVDAGASTWGSGTAGVSGTISASNSLVGTKASDQVGNNATALTNGNYVVRSYGWDNGTVVDAGAATWASGTTGISGTISTSNSLVGSSTTDQVGAGVMALANGNYVVNSSSWDNGAAANAGAVTWANGATGLSGAVGAANSLVGTTAGDNVGGNVTVLTNGNYVVGSYSWDNGAVANVGAVTWCSGTASTSGVVSASNSLVGTKATDLVSSYGITALPNGNYVVTSANWDNGAVVDVGAVTWGSGTSGISGPVSTSNSLVGGTANDLNSTSVQALPSGNYVVSSAGWDNGAAANAGAATWGNGSTGVSGTIGAANSLVGTTAGDNVGGNVTVLTNGNYVVSSSNWDNGAVANVGAVTWGNGTNGTSGAVNATNSLIGTKASDQVGNSFVIAVANGSYIIRSSLWDNGAIVDAGVITLGNGLGGPTGGVSACTGTVGSTASQGSTLAAAYNATADKLLTGLPKENKVVVGLGGAAAPTGAASQTVTAGSTVASLVATGTAIKWYAAANGGAALASTTALTNGTTYYASQTVAGCESTPRLAVAVTFAPPAISSFTPTSGIVGSLVTLTGTGLGGATSVSFNGTAATAISSNTATALTVVVPVGATSGPLTVTTSASGTSAASSQAYTVLACPAGTRLYVNTTQATSGTGDSWATAYKSLGEALAQANACPAIVDIWVAKGTYIPNRDGNLSPLPTDAREKTFYLVRDGLKLYGGFAGTETALTDRVAANVTILSGDIDGDDFTTGTITGNAYHVLLSTSATAATVLDGFTVRAGNANGTSAATVGGRIIYRTYAGGFFNSASSSPTVTNCVFTANTAKDYGGVLYLEGGSTATFTGCTFSSNVSNTHGGALYNNAASPTFTSCTFTGNRAAFTGGVMYGGPSGRPTFVSCTLSGNYTMGGEGGAIYYYGGTPVLTGCAFSGNYTGGGSGGGAVSFASGTPTVTNCTFSTNSASSGGALYLSNAATLTLLNCTLSGNSASTSGSGLCYTADAGGTVRNCILVNNTTPPTTDANREEIFKAGTTAALAVSYSTVRDFLATAPGNYTATSLSTASPLFVNAADPDGADNLFRTLDDGLALQASSPAANASDPATTTPTTDITGAPRTGVFDKGAYELPRPTIAATGLSPTSGLVGSTLVLTGTNLKAATAITFGGTSGNVVVAGFAINAAGTQISGVVVPTGAVTGTLTVTTPAGTTAASTQTYTVLPGAVTAFEPAAELPGQAVTLTGTGFTPGSAVSFGGVAAGSVTYNSPTSLTAAVPAGAATGASPVVVTTPSGSSSTPTGFAVLAVYDGGPVGSCAAAVPATASLNDGAWHYLLSGGGQVVAAYSYTGASLGDLALDVLQANPAQPVRQDPRQHAYLDRNWHLSASAGRFDNRTVALRLYGLNTEQARLQAADPAATLANLKATQYSGPNEDCDLANDDASAEHRTLVPTATSSPAGTPYFVVELPVADHFSEFYLTGSSTPLPVELTAFTATAAGTSTVRLAWATASEKNSMVFEVERSLSGTRFERIATVAAAGSSSAPRSYELLDAKLPVGTALLYYRLKQVDLDGSFSYSPVRSVTLSGKAAEAGLALFPNPAHGGAATLTGALPGTVVTVFDALGRFVTSAPADAAGTAALALPAGLPAGVYVVRAGARAVRLTVE